MALVSTMNLGALRPPPLANTGHLVPVTGALVLVAVSPRWNAMTFFAAQPAVLEAVVLDARLRAPHLALAIAESCENTNTTTIQLANSRSMYARGKFSLWFRVCYLSQPWQLGGRKKRRGGREMPMPEREPSSSFERRLDLDFSYVKEVGDLGQHL